MSVHVLDLVWRRSAHKGSDLLLMLAIADNANDGGVAWPGIEHLSSKSRLSERAVQYAVSRLLDGDELTLVRRGGGSQSNVYRVEIETLRGKPPRKHCTPAKTAPAQVAHEKTQPAAPEPSVEPSGETASPPIVPPADFETWLAHHERVTGRKPPRPGTQARKHIAAMYEARREEGYSAEDLLHAVDGAQADEFRRTNGHTGCESVLRPRKVHELVEKGRQAPAARGGECRGCGASIDQFHLEHRDGL